MKQTELEVSYTSVNTYSTLNGHSNATKNIWFAFHGMGYLSRYFVNYFEGLDKQKNYIIAPQAPSKYYQGKRFNYIGASWLTRENTKLETQNVLNFTEAVAEKERVLNQTDKLIVFGYSQGVSIALRWIALKQVACKAIVIHSGGIPKELTPEHFSFLSKNTPVYLIYGTQDEYITAERIQLEKELALQLFGNRLEIIPFDGKHKVNTDLIEQIGLKL